MQDRGKFTLVRLLPVVLVTLAAAAWFNDVQNGGPYVPRNLLPLLVLVLLSWFTLHRGEGRWSGNGMRLPLATMGFAIPALGLALHLIYVVRVGGDFMAGRDGFADYPPAEDTNGLSTCTEFLP